MDHPEMSPGDEPASPEALGGLYELGEGWLKRHGTNSHALGAKILGWHEGYPITHEQPEFSYLITEDEAKAISKDAVETLRLSGNLEMNISEACYIQDPAQPDELNYEDSTLTFHVPRPGGEPITAVGFSIGISDGEFIGHRYEQISDDIPRPPTPSIMDAGAELIERLRLEHETGYDKITRSEAASLRALVEGIIANPPTPPAMG